MASSSGDQLGGSQEKSRDLSGIGLRPVKELYVHVLDGVMRSVEEAFLDEGIDKDVWRELEYLWQSKLASWNVIDPVEQPVPNSSSGIQGQSGSENGKLVAAPPAPFLPADPQTKIPVEVEVNIPGCVLDFITIHVPYLSIQDNKLQQILALPEIREILNNKNSLHLLQSKVMDALRKQLVNLDNVIGQPLVEAEASSAEKVSGSQSQNSVIKVYPAKAKLHGPGQRQDAVQLKEKEHRKQGPSPKSRGQGKRLAKADSEILNPSVKAKTKAVQAILSKDKAPVAVATKGRLVKPSFEKKTVQKAKIAADKTPGKMVCKAKTSKPKPVHVPLRVPVQIPVPSRRELGGEKQSEKESSPAKKRRGRPPRKSLVANLQLDGAGGLSDSDDYDDNDTEEDEDFDTDLDGDDEYEGSDTGSTPQPLLSHMLNASKIPISRELVELTKMSKIYNKSTLDMDQADSEEDNDGNEDNEKSADFVDGQNDAETQIMVGDDEDQPGTESGAEGVDHLMRAGIYCQYEKITRTRNKWKFYLKDGILNIRGKEYLFQKAQGDAEW